MDGQGSSIAQKVLKTKMKEDENYITLSDTKMNKTIHFRILYHSHDIKANFLHSS